MFSNSYVKKCKALNLKPMTQDEIVELCKKLPKYQKKSYLQLLSNFRIGLQRMCCESYLETQTLNDLWLMFYIFEKSGWIWIEGRGEWLPLNKFSKKSLNGKPERGS